ncbi:MAG TPA: DUF411 domain-containing protein [Longimicrobiales bacterium]|nr:DUF411 domain-containing protein [Longimicrobiales bacterium]
MKRRFESIGVTVVLLLAAWITGCGADGDGGERFVIGSAAAGTLPASLAANEGRSVAEAVTITVYKSPTCGCCTAWEEHLRAHGFVVESRPTVDMVAVKTAHAIPASLSSCHTAIVDGYIIEGHVPADLIARLLKERPDVRGLTVPGMPMGSPGMEGPYKDPYDVLTFDAQGNTTIYASR